MWYCIEPFGIVDMEVPAEPTDATKLAAMCHVST